MSAVAAMGGAGVLETWMEWAVQSAVLILVFFAGELGAVRSVEWVSMKGERERQRARSGGCS